MADPALGPVLAVQLCEQYKFNADCEGIYGITGTGSVVTQVVANADVGGLDGQVGCCRFALADQMLTHVCQMLCQNFLGLCPLAPASPLNLTSWFAKEKPSPLPAPKAPSGKRLKVLHISDAHIDPRMHPLAYGGHGHN